MKTSTAFFGSLLLGLVGLLPVQASETVKASLWQNWLQDRQQVTEETLSFTETQYDPLLEIKSTKKGQLSYLKNQQVVQQFTQPFQGQITYQFHKIKFELPSRNLLVTQQQSADALIFSQALLNLLAGNEPALAKIFTIHIKPLSGSNARAWQVALVPKQRNNWLSEIKVTGQGQRLQSILLTQPSGDWRLINLDKRR